MSTINKQKVIKVNELKRLLTSIDGNTKVALLFLNYILKNKKRIYAFLKKHDLNESFYYPLANIFALIDINDSIRKELQKHKDLNLKILCQNQSKLLYGLKSDKELMKVLTIDESLIDQLLSRNKIIMELPFPKRYNDKTILKKKLKKVFVMFEKKGLGQTKQINIIMDLFVQEGFEDYKNGKSKNRFERIRKTYQEPAVSEYKKDLYGK